MAEPQGQNVQVSRTVLLSLVLGLVLCLMTVAFLLGRQSAPASVAATPSVSPSPSAVAVVPGESGDRLEVSDVPQVPPPAPPPESAPAPRPTPSAAPPAAVVTPALPPPSNVPVGHAGRPAHRHSSELALQVAPGSPNVARQSVAPASPQVLSYLASVDAVMASTGDIGDPTQFASGVVGQGENGDSSGFDDLIKKTKHAQASLARIHPPASCLEHYRLLQGQLADSVNLLQSVKKATVALDSSSLPALAAQGQAMQAKVDRLKALTAKLRNGY